MSVALFDKIASVNRLYERASNLFINKLDLLLSDISAFSVFTKSSNREIHFVKVHPESGSCEKFSSRFAKFVDLVFELGSCKALNNAKHCFSLLAASSRRTFSSSSRRILSSSRRTFSCSRRILSSSLFCSLSFMNFSNISICSLILVAIVVSCFVCGFATEQLDFY